MSNVIANILVAIVVLVFGFLIGSIPNSVLIGKIFYHIDIREYGSKNPGGTNVGRVLGKKAGIAVIALDILKGIIAFWVVWAILRFSGLRSNFALWNDAVPYNYLVFIGVAIGHCFSPWLHFKGGKAVACHQATVGGYSYLMFILCIVCFFPVFFKKRIMSIASIVQGGLMLLAHIIMYLLCNLTSFSGAIFAFSLGAGGGIYWCNPATPWVTGWEPVAAALFVYVLLVIRHSSNI
ncbi:MAG: glycerol-3-phosphate 1-O-acyltransferase PlsY, partial [Bacilli bacterium]|nr:glycerol-3-phosphate 1-O-acyltransferase PlsY [Bacilli bacterium]